jgi:hypothetical protein
MEERVAGTTGAQESALTADGCQQIEIIDRIIFFRSV